MTRPERTGWLARREQAYVRRWLTTHAAPELAASPLVAARIAARLRAAWLEAGAIGVVSATFLGLVGWNLITAGPVIGPTGSLALFGAAYLILAMASVAARWQARRADRRIGRTLRHRVARPAAMSLRSLLGGRLIAAAVVIYGGGLLVGTALALLAGDDTDRRLAAVFGVGVIMFAGLAATVLAEASRRPAIATDELSLHGDDLLRRSDARDQALAPYVACLALVSAAGSTPGSELFPVFSLYVAVAMIFFAIAFWDSFRVSYRPARQTPATLPDLGS